MMKMNFLSGPTLQRARHPSHHGTAGARSPSDHHLLAALLALFAAGGFLCADAQPNVLVYDAEVDGQVMKFPTALLTPSESQTNTNIHQAENLRLSSHARTLGFRFGPSLSTLNSPVRLRYRLKGVDTQWRDVAGEMRLNLKFVDADNKTVSAQDFNAAGESIGWAGTVARSRFIRRHEEMIVPSGSVRVQIELYSGGSEPTIGVMAIDDFTLAMTSKTNQPPLQLFSSKSIDWKADDAGNSIPEGWVREGSLPSIARTASTGENKPRYVLMIADNDPTRWGAWGVDRQLPVTPGESLILEWSEMFSVGWGGEGWARYSHLSPGQYLFQVRTATETGVWTDGEAVVAVAIVPPLWDRTWFRLTMLTAGVALLVAGVRYVTWRRMQTRLEETERRRAVEHERTRIARDIHDDLGANLTQIALLSELAQTDMGNPAQARNHLTQIFSAARSMTRQLDEIVWAVDPENDWIEATINYVCKFAQDYLCLAGVRCRLDVPETTPRIMISSAERHNLFLVVKEALHNIIKHANASEVWLRIEQDTDALVLLIEDNGGGFDEKAKIESTPAGAGRHGIQNMNKRMARIGARFEQQSTPGKGTIVRLILPLAGR